MFDRTFDPSLNFWPHFWLFHSQLLKVIVNACRHSNGLVYVIRTGGNWLLSSKVVLASTIARWWCHTGAIPEAQKKLQDQRTDAYVDQACLRTKLPTEDIVNNKKIILLNQPRFCGWFSAWGGWFQQFQQFQQCPTITVVCKCLMHISLKGGNLQRGIGKCSNHLLSENSACGCSLSWSLAKSRWSSLLLWF